MTETDPDRATQLVEALKRKGANKPCPMCGNLHFGFVAETLIPVNDGTGASAGGLVVPTVIVACKNCGFMTQHALGALDVPVEEAARAG